MVLNARVCTGAYFPEDTRGLILHSLLPPFARSIAIPRHIISHGPDVIYQASGSSSGNSVFKFKQFMLQPMKP